MVTVQNGTPNEVSILIWCYEKCEAKIVLSEQTAMSEPGAS